MNGTHTAVLDRIVDGKHAVLLLEEGGETVEQLNVAVEVLPDDGQHERAVFEVKISGDELVDVEYYPEEEKKRLEAAEEWNKRTGKRLDNKKE